MTTTVYLVRHGTHDQLQGRLCGRTPGVLMGEAGLRQAQAVAGRLVDAGVEAVDASPLERTRQTAEPIARALGLEPRLEPDLQEIDFGAWNGARFDELRGDAEWSRWNADRGRACPPGGENMAEVTARVAGWLERAAASGARAVAGVSHSDVIKAAVAHVLGLPLAFHDRFEISPGSVTTIAAGPWGLKLHCLNEVPPCPN